MVCSRCGQIAPDGATFCSTCGQPSPATNVGFAGLPPQTSTGVPGSVVAEKTSGLAIFGIPFLFSPLFPSWLSYSDTFLFHKSRRVQAVWGARVWRLPGWCSGILGSP